MSFRILTTISIALFLPALSCMVHAEEANRVYMDETYISGNQELPTVLYILPWKNQHGEIVPALNPSLVDRQIMVPIYPHEYRREIAYRALVNPDKPAVSSLEE